MSDRERVPRRILTGLLAGFLLATGFPVLARAAPAPPTRPPSASWVFYDLRLTMRARRVLLEDRELASLNIGVKVSDGVATLWGPIPSADAARRALRLVGQVDGVARVQSDLYVENKLPPLDLFGKSAPTQVSSASPDRESGSLEVFEGLVRELPPPPTLSVPPPPGPLVARMVEARQMPDNGALPLRRQPVAPRALADLASRPLADLPVPPPPVSRPPRPPPPLVAIPRPPAPGAKAASAGPAKTSKEAIVQAVERLRKENTVFQAVQYEVRGRTVVVRPGEAAGEYATAFAEEVRKIRGVGEVLLEE